MVRTTTHGDGTTSACRTRPGMRGAQFAGVAWRGVALYCVALIMCHHTHPVRSCVRHARYAIDQNAPLATAFTQVGITWAATLIAAVSVTGLTATTLTSLFGQPRKWRMCLVACIACCAGVLPPIPFPSYPIPSHPLGIFYRMSRDGLLFKQFGRLHPTTQTPVVGTIVTVWSSSMQDDAYMQTEAASSDTSCVHGAGRLTWKTASGEAETAATHVGHHASWKRIAVTWLLTWLCIHQLHAISTMCV